MAHYKVFTDRHGNELKAHLNNEKECFIEIDSDISGYSKWIVLDHADLTEFIEALTTIKKSIDTIP